MPAAADKYQMTMGQKKTRNHRKSVVEPTPIDHFCLVVTQGSGGNISRKRGGLKLNAKKVWTGVVFVYFVEKSYFCQFPMLFYFVGWVKKPKL